LSPLELPEIDPRPSLHYPLYETGLHKFVVAFFRWAFKPIMALDVRGLENLPQAGAGIVAANHLTNFDVFPLQLALPRMLFYMGKAELFQNEFLHAVFRQMGAFPIYRGERDSWALEHATRILAAEQLLAMFPEGTRSRGKGLSVAKTGVARLAIETGAPIVTISVDGSQRFFKQFPRRNPVRVVIAPPIYPTKDLSALSLTDQVMFTMAANLPEALRGVYAQLPPGFSPTAKQ